MRRGEKIPRAVFGCAAAAGLVWFLIPLHWGVMNVGSLAGAGFCIAVLCTCLLFPALRSACKKSRAVRRAASAMFALFCLALIWSAAMTVCMLSVGEAEPPGDAVVVVLGSKVAGSSPSADLWARIGAASDYLKTHPKAVCLASGGRGPGENLTEASVIRSQLIAMGADPQRILTEESSSSTKENFVNSLRIINEKQLGRSLAVVTDEYHEFRACSIARSLGARPYAVPAHTPWYIFSACWAREVLALTKYLIFG